MRDLYGTIAAGLYFRGTWEDGRLLCCCVPPGDCCLYPGMAFYPDGLYPIDDLPATLVVTIDGSPVTLTKGGSHPVYYTGTWSGHDVTINNGWRLYIRGFDSGVEGDAAAYDFTCLVSSSFTPHEDNPPEAPSVTAVEDEFPDTLTITFNVDGSPQPRDGERMTPCEYIHGDVDTMSLKVIYDSAIFKWKYILILFEADWPGYGGTYTGEKDDPQDSPIGTYASDGIITGFTVS